MARQTRAERRARRRQQQAEASNGLVERARARQGQVRPAQQPATAEIARPPRAEPRGLARFFSESWGELKKVEWPSQNHVIQGTVVVLVACVILGVYIWLSDIAFRHLVNDVLLR